ncbi:MAG: hypothetical protein WA071_14840 [Undibacterium umbellatum]|uniref:hypothetical protein n=1 Tax=Undibacterium umbellatum TaxID=2762300 RepID=UPI003BB4D2F6
MKLPDRPLPEKLIYSLKEAAATLGWDTRKVLNLGAEGKLKFCVSIPTHNVLVYAVQRNWIPKFAALKPNHFRSRMQRGSGEIVKDLKYLLLSSADCVDLLHFTEVKQEVFELGYMFSGSMLITLPVGEEVVPDVLIIDEPGSDPITFTAIPDLPPKLVFCTNNINVIQHDYWDKQFLEPLQITDEQVFISTAELNAFLESQSAVSVTPVSNGHPDDAKKSWSLKLQRLVEVHEDFWKGAKCSKEVREELSALYLQDDNSREAQKIRRDNINAREREIRGQLEKLKSQIGTRLFNSGSLLQGCINIVRPDRLQPAQKMNAETKNRSEDKSLYHSSQLAALIAVADVDINSKEEKITREKIIKVLIEKYQFSGNDAAIGATILRQEDAPKGRPKNKVANNS